MIPAPTPALTGLSVLVTRPAESCASLCLRIESLGGEAVPWPAVVIEPLAAPLRVSSAPGPGPHSYDLVIFVSQNAVAHGLKHIVRSSNTLIAAIGKSTAAALTVAGATPEIVPETGYTSEALLEAPGLQAETVRRVLIVRGGTGREVLEETLLARGIEVDCLEVYRRVPAVVDAAASAALETRWLEGDIDIVTATSGEILHNLHRMLSDACRKLLATSPLLVVSPRLAEAAHALGCRGEMLVSPAADDDTLVGVLARWRTRARIK